MNHRNAGLFALFLLFVPLSILIIGCPASSPSSPGPSAPANTATPTFTQACFLGTSPTCTPTHTATHTATPCPNTPTVTATVVTTDYVTGTASYTGSTGTVSGTNPIAIVAFGTANLDTSPSAFVYVTTNGGTYTMYAPAPSTGYLMAIFDSNGAGPYDNFPVGSPYTINGGGAGGCQPPAAATNVSGATAGPNFSFGDTCRVPGIYGNATYTGSLGTVSNCRRILVRSYTDAAYTTATNNSTSEVKANGGRYDHTTFDSGATTPVYVRAFYDADGNGNPSTGDPYSNRGLLTPNATGGLVHSFSFNDSTLLP